MESRKDFKKSVVTIGGAIACLLVLLLGIGTALAQTPPLSNTPVEQPPRIPNTPAGQTLNAFLDAFNSGDHARLETYVHTYAPSDTADDLVSFSSQTGGFRLLSIVDSRPGFISFRVVGRADHLEAYGSFTLASTDPPK